MKIGSTPCHEHDDACERGASANITGRWSLGQPPAGSALAAASLIADDDPAQPRSLTLIAGPVDARINPGPVNGFAERKSLP